MPPIPLPHGAQLGRAVAAWDEAGAEPDSRLMVGWHARRRAAVHLARSLGAHGPWRSALAQAVAPAEGPGPWPVRALVVDGAEALGLRPEAIAGLLAAAYLWHAAADALDDAMDGDAPADGPPKSPWSRTATVAVALLQQAPGLACQSATAHTVSLRRAFARSGLRMAKGQDRDLQLAQLWAGGPERLATPPGGWAAAWEAAALGKAGGAMGLYATLPALAVGAPRPLVEGLWALGEALGLAWQLSSDLTDAPGPGQSPGLEQLFALMAFDDPAERQQVWASWEGLPEAPPWQVVRDLSGAGSLVQAHLVQAWAKAESLAGGLAKAGASPELVAVALDWVAEGRDTAQAHGPWGSATAWGGAWV